MYNTFYINSQNPALYVMDNFSTSSIQNLTLIIIMHNTMKKGCLVICGHQRLYFWPR